MAKVVPAAEADEKGGATEEEPGGDGGDDGDDGAQASAPPPRGQAAAAGGEGGEGGEGGPPRQAAVWPLQSVGRLIRDMLRQQREAGVPEVAPAAAGGHEITFAPRIRIRTLLSSGSPVLLPALCV